MKTKKKVKLTRNMVMFRIHGLSANIKGILNGKEHDLLSNYELEKLVIARNMIEMLINNSKK